MKNIRDASHFDAQSIYQLFKSVYSTTDFMADDFENAFPNPEKLWASILELKNHPGSFLLASFVESGNTEIPTGYIWIKSREQKKLQHTADLTMGISAEHRGRGLGAQLLKAAEERIQNEKLLEIIYLFVREDNEPAVQFYRKNSFELLARLEKDTKIGSRYFNGLLMRKFIS